MSEMSEFTSGLSDPQEHAELIREKGRIEAKEKEKRKRILRRFILTASLAMEQIYKLRFHEEFSRKEWKEIREILESE